MGCGVYRSANDTAGNRATNQDGLQVQRFIFKSAGGKVSPCAGASLLFLHVPVNFCMCFLELVSAAAARGG